jgi:hypothetical protein
MGGVTSTRRLAGHRSRRPPDALTGRSWRQPSARERRDMRPDVVLDMGWGRLVFGQTFDDLSGVVAALRAEESGRRDICVHPWVSSGCPRCA